MTVQNPAIFLQAGSHPAEDVRRFLGSLPMPGVVTLGDLAVTEKSGTPNMSVDVAGGRAFIAGTEATYQGTYMVENRGAANLAVAAADPTNARKDLVVARVKDAAYSGATNAWELAVVTGTPAPSPSEPAVPANSLVLALVTVAAGTTSITNANITDRRTDARTRLPAERRYGAAVTGGPTSGGTELTLATVTIPAQPYAWTLDAAAHWSAYNSAASDTFQFRIRVDGTEKAYTANRWPTSGANIRTGFALPTITPVEFAAGAGATVTVTIQRGAGGSGTLTEEAPGRVTCRVYPRNI